jgi:glucose/galactose transporter
MPVLILGILFFIFGFITWLNGTLIQYLKIACELNTYQSLLVAFAFYIAYFVTALPSSWILQKTGFKNGMMLGLFIMAAGALVFIPAAMSRTYGLFLTGLFIIGTGLSVLQTASNPYITIVGPIETAARRISIMGICNKFAAVLSPIILAAIVLSDADTLVARLQLMDAAQKAAELNSLAYRVITPYSIMAAVLFLLGIAVYFSPLPDIEAEQPQDVMDLDTKEGEGLMSHTNLVYGVIALFLYVGTEVIAGDTIGGYGQSWGISIKETRNFTSFTMAAMVLGYIAGIIAIPRFINQARALSVSAIGGILITLLALFTSGYTSVFLIALLGLANALIWPAIWPLAIHGLGKYTKTGSALLIMSIAGGALLPLLYGRLADMPQIGHQSAYWILIPCYAFILWYSIYGRRVKRA